MKTLKDIKFDYKIKDNIVFEKKSKCYLNDNKIKVCLKDGKVKEDDYELRHVTYKIIYISEKSLILYSLDNKEKKFLSRDEDILIKSLNNKEFNN